MSSKTQPRCTAGRFRNPPGAPRSDAGRGDFAAFLWRRAIDRRRPEPPLGHILPRPEVEKGLEAYQYGDAATWLGHASYLLRWGGQTLLTDPFLSKVAAPRPAMAPRRFARPALRVHELPPIDWLLISHSHYDHFDVPTLARLPNKRDVRAVVPLGLGGKLRRLGYQHIHELGWWHSVATQGLIVTAVPAIHFSRRGPFDGNKSLWCGFMIETLGGKRVYFAGDTAYHPVFKEIGSSFSPVDLALLPIGAYEPREIMAGAHVNPEEAAAIAEDVGARIAAAMHWGSIVLTEEPPFEPPRRFRRALEERGFRYAQIWIPAIGETARF
jgi:L-ascorbate metabolism protein UlaG (beta-lactamase superfamily)